MKNKGFLFKILALVSAVASVVFACLLRFNVRISVGGESSNIGNSWSIFGDATRAEKVELAKLGSVAQIALDRYWYADGVSAAGAPESVRTVLNGDNIFLAADGVIRNVSVRDLSLFTEMEAQVVYNDSYSFEATLACECNEGTELDMSMLPMAQARLVVYAEIPAYLAADESASWKIVLTADGSSLEYELQ